MVIAQHVLDWAKQPGPEQVLAAIRERIEQGRCGPRARINLPLDTKQRGQVGAILHASWAWGDDPVMVARLKEGLAQHDVVLEDLLEVLGGPLRDLRAERAATRQSHQADRTQGVQILRDLDPRVPEVVIERCLMRPASNYTERARAISQVIEAAVIEGEHLAVLAARLFGDAHALDRSQDLGRAVARFLSGSTGEQSDDGVTLWRDPIQDSTAWRQAWATRGIVCDEVSAQVLVLNLPLTGDAAAVRLSDVPGEPVWLSLRSLRGQVRLSPNVNSVFVCENPSIVEAAADQFGANTQPLVCTFGVPSRAAIELLYAIADQTALHVRADEDEVGRRIVHRLLQLPNSSTWHMQSEHVRYEEEILEDLLRDLSPSCITDQ